LSYAPTVGTGGKEQTKIITFNSHSRGELVPWHCAVLKFQGCSFPIPRSTAAENNNKSPKFRTARSLHTDAPRVRRPSNCFAVITSSAS